MYSLIVDWRSPKDGRQTHAADGTQDVADTLARLALMLRTRADQEGKTTVVITLKDKSAAGKTARKRKTR